MITRTAAESRTTKIDEAVAAFYDLLARQMFGCDLADVPTDDQKMEVIERAEVALSSWVDDQAFDAAAYEQPAVALGLLKRYAELVAELNATEDAMVKSAAAGGTPNSSSYH